MVARVLILVALLAAADAVSTSSDDLCARMCPSRQPQCPSPCQACPSCPSCPAVNCASPPQIPACPTPVVNLTCPMLPSTCPTPPPCACPSCPSCPAVHCPPPPQIPACPTPVVNLTCPAPAPCTIPPCPPPPKCPVPPKEKPRGYTTVPGLGTYKLYKDKMNWYNANITCGHDGGYLAIPDSLDELKQLLQTMSVNGIKFIHIGFYDENHENEFHTVLGQPMTNVQKTLWSAGEPNGGTEHNCVYLHIEKQRILDEPCNDSESFMCEI